MQRRQFLGLGLVAVVATVVPSTLLAQDYRTTNPNTWTAHAVNDAVQALYGTTQTIEEGITVITPDVASDAGGVPVTITSNLSGKSLAVFQDTNPESTVAVFTLNENSIIDFKTNIKLKSDGSKPVTVTVILEGNDGKLYSGTKTLIVPTGGCDS